ncbi:hypothetical protein, variant 1 [Aphanomyces astaci]|uniref:Uncharacterized protein n=1 Tax=Aphanomyces astaci TaxID=112090 RepID=W4GPH1_APHAT|nr:hypothetical protein, variant 1 [Aphanomyces astaci]ETV81582.1 hypothetical protein, variant 1 [Aphanomyces astaci]|eukprot:XP_009829443.1 hypothetical protein, variant 1 [Aphanomyces astaci]
MRSAAVHAVVVGECGVGKTSLVHAIEATAVYYQVAPSNRSSQPICVVECASLAHCKELNPQVIVLAFDLSRPDSFAGIIAKWATFGEQPHTTKTILVGCKSNLATNDMLVSSEAKHYAETEFDAYFETSDTVDHSIDQIRLLLLPRATSESRPIETNGGRTMDKNVVVRETIAVDKATRDIWLYDKSLFVQQSVDIHGSSSASKARIFLSGLAISKRHDIAANERGLALSSRFTMQRRKSPVEIPQGSSSNAPRKQKRIHLTNTDGTSRSYSFMQPTRASIHRAEALSRKNENIDEFTTDAPTSVRTKPCTKQPSPILKVLDGLAKRTSLQSVCDTVDTNTNMIATIPTADKVEVDGGIEIDVEASPVVDQVEISLLAVESNDPPRPLESQVAIEGWMEAPEVTPHAEPLVDHDQLIEPPATTDVVMPPPDDALSSIGDDDDITFDDDDVLDALESFQLSI